MLAVRCTDEVSNNTQGKHQKLRLIFK